MPVRFEEPQEVVGESDRAQVRFQETPHSGEDERQGLGRAGEILSFGLILCGHTYSAHIDLPEGFCFDLQEETGSRPPCLGVEVPEDCRDLVDVGAAFVQRSGCVGGGVIEVIVHAKGEKHGRYSATVKALEGSMAGEGGIRIPVVGLILAEVCGCTMQNDKGTPSLRSNVSCIGRGHCPQTEDSDW